MHKATLLLTMPKDTGLYKIKFAEANHSLMVCRMVINVMKSFDHSNEPVTSFPSK